MIPLKSIVKVFLVTYYSEASYITYAVLQASIMGPLIFLLYVNDMPQAVKSNLFLYDVDSYLIFQGKSVKKIEKQLNGDLPTFEIGL